jgi:hypothetical protein
MKGLLSSQIESFLMYSTRLISKFWMSFYNQNEIEITITLGYRISHLHTHLYGGRVYLNTMKLSGLQLIDSIKAR